MYSFGYTGTLNTIPTQDKPATSILKLISSNQGSLVLRGLKKVRDLKRNISVPPESDKLRFTVGILSPVIPAKKRVFVWTL